MSLFLTIVHVIVCFILILVILLQAGRGQGLTGPSFSSGNVQSLLGTRAGDFLTKATSVAAIGFLLTCIGLDILEARKSRSLLAGRPSEAPIDIDAIKKALEKMKAEEGAPAAQTAETTVDSLQETAQNVLQTAEATASGTAADTVENQKAP